LNCIQNPFLFIKLAAENPEYYDIDYANNLFGAVYLYKMDKQLLLEAKTILLKYPNIKRAQGLIQSIDKLYATLK
jgi:hypothetical protein